MFRNYHQSTIFIVLLFLDETSPVEKICNATIDTTNNVEWPTTTNKTLSSPICLNQNKEFVYRECVEGQWSSTPTCYFTQQKTLPECPENFVDAGSMCYMLTSETSFPPQCPFEDVLPFELYKDVVVDDNLGPVWVPAKRDGLSFMQWLEASWSYKKEVLEYKFTKPLIEKECLVFFQQEFTLVSCNDKYTGVCAYKKLDQNTDNLCGSLFPCVQSDFSAKSKCFCKGTTRNYFGFTMAKFIKPYQYNTYKMISNDSCAIGLVKTPDSKYIWNHSDEEITYTFWSPNAVFDDGLVFGVGTPDGWILIENSTACFVFEKDPENLEPSLQLEFDESNTRFNLTVVNPQKLKIYNTGPLLYCLTNAEGLRLLYPYPTLTIIRYYRDSIQYAFEPLKNSSGDYWCEAFRHSDLEIIETEKYFFRPIDYLEFVGIFQVHYNNGTNPLSQEISTLVENYLFAHVNLSYIYTMRVLKITDLDENQQFVSVNVHIISTELTDTNRDENLYLVLKIYFEDILHGNEDVFLIDFMSSDFCPSEHGNLTWPKASLGSVVNPEEFCFRPDGSSVTRSCEGDFTNGVHWSDFDECEIFKDSLITTKLLRVFNSSGSQTINQIHEISQNYQEFTSLDVYLVAKVYSEYIYIPHIGAFAETINNIIKIDKSVLSEAQSKLKATDKLLHSIDTIKFASWKTFQFNFENFVFMSMEPSNLSGLVVTRNRHKLVVTKLVGDYTFEELTRIENLESAVWVSPDFRKKVDRVTISMYFDDALFLQNRTANTGIIFNVIRTSSKYFSGPIFILRRNKNRHHHHPMKSFCAFWDYDLQNQGSWRYIYKARASADFVQCSFWNSANFAIINLNADHDDSKDENVTDDLIDLLHSNDSVPETMEKLSQISEKYYHFEAGDLSVVGQILERVSDNKEVDFSNLATTVSNIQQVDRVVLMQSQLQGQATDTILANIDSIIKNHNFDDIIQVNTDHFMIFVVDGNRSFSGVAFLHQHDLLKPVFLDSKITIDDVIDKDSFDSAVVLSTDLQHQISEETKITITVYSGDALFNEQSPKHKFVSKIFGVILSDVEEFAGPISIIYKGKEMNEEQCVYWYYDHSNNMSGLWRQDGNYTNTSNLVQCDFWHTTHFAYLILDEKKFAHESDDIFDLLGIVTYINCILSLLSLTCIVLTGIFFKQWRDNTGNQILLNFTFVIIIQIVIFFISNTVAEEYRGYIQCTIVGILLHYSIVSQFCWMFIIAILQFRRFVIVLEGPPKFVLLKACFCGWALPLLPVGCVFFWDKENYVKSNVGLCYPSGLGLYLGVWLPICIIIVINFVLFSITLYNVVHRKTESVMGSSDALYQWRLAVLLFFMLGFTWCFGFLAIFEFGLVFEYLFCMTATLQGFTLFLFFIVLNANTRYLYVTAVGRFCKRKSR